MYRRGLVYVLGALCTLSRQIDSACALQQYPFAHDVNEQLEVNRGAGWSDDYKHNKEELGNIPNDNARVRPLEDMLAAIKTMQDTYFNVYAGTWPDAIDWTAAVMGTHISGTLSSLVFGLASTGSKKRADSAMSNRLPSCEERLSWENVVNKYYMQTALFYFGENAFALRNQAFDDMLWVVLGWLENLKFARMYSTRYWEANDRRGRGNTSWHGVQTVSSAAHRARIFYELASKGWDTELCGGGMVWNSNLDPYKNAITNELFATASVAMYLYFPGDNNSSPFVNAADQGPHRNGSPRPNDPVYLENAVKSYKWLKESGMQGSRGLYGDGYHINGWRRFRNGTIDPGTKQCDSLNPMVYSYNQGVILSASRGLWLATGAKSYLDDGHYLIDSVIDATGWHDMSGGWAGLGQAGVLEEECDHRAFCSQDGQTFKGIFFHHLIEFCRPLWLQEEDFITSIEKHTKLDRHVYRSHLSKCAKYGRWIEHNARAALKTRDEHGLFGMWWGVSTDLNHTLEHDLDRQQDLPRGAIDHLNPVIPIFDAQDLNNRGRGRTVETQSGGLAVLRAHWQWQSHSELSA